MVVYESDTITELKVGTKVFSNYTNRKGVIVECCDSMKDCDGTYGVGWKIEWEGRDTLSEVTKSELEIWYKKTHICNKKMYEEFVKKVVYYGL